MISSALRKNLSKTSAALCRRHQHLLVGRDYLMSASASPASASLMLGERTDTASRSFVTSTATMNAQSHLMNGNLGIDNHHRHRDNHRLRQQQQLPTRTTVRSLSFSFAGPRKLDDIIKTDLLKDKTSVEISDIWYRYHEDKV